MQVVTNHAHSDTRLPSRRLEATDCYAGRARELGAWIKTSLRPDGGSSAYYMPGYGWVDAYPETTGYLIPTLLELDRRFPGEGYGAYAERAGEWLLAIQSGEGWWPAGRWPQRETKPSLFNSGQILTGMVSLFDETREQKWIDAAARASTWMASRVDDTGAWPGGDYSATRMPSYYAHAAAPMLRVWEKTKDQPVHDAAVAVLETIAGRRQPNGAFADAGFREGSAAPTHTVAYTLWGFLDAADAVRASCWRDVARPGIDVLVRRAELSGGSLPGSYDEAWKKGTSTVCLTGNVQLALCFLEVDRHEPDLRLVNAAAKLVDFVCDARVPGLSAAVPGSWPLWGPYMRFRFPNWSAKYACDAIFALMDRLESELTFS